MFFKDENYVTNSTGFNFHIFWAPIFVIEQASNTDR